MRRAENCVPSAIYALRRFLPFLLLALLPACCWPPSSLAATFSYPPICLKTSRPGVSIVPARPSHGTHSCGTVWLSFIPGGCSRLKL